MIRLQFQTNTSLQRDCAGGSSTIERSCSLSCGGRNTGSLLQSRGCARLRLDGQHGGKGAAIERGAAGRGSERRKHSCKGGTRGRIKRNHRFELLIVQGKCRENAIIYGVWYRLKLKLGEVVTCMMQGSYSLGTRVQSNVVRGFTSSGFCSERSS